MYESKQLFGWNLIFVVKILKFASVKLLISNSFEVGILRYHVQCTRQLWCPKLQHI